MSHPSGLDILRQLRIQGYGGKVVVLGGQSTQSLTSEAMRLGTLQIVGCPFNANQVLGAAGVATTLINLIMIFKWQFTCD